jgi:hypothetical protein
MLYKEWDNIKKCEILRPRGALNKLRNKRLSLVFFLILGGIFGVILRWQLSLLWDRAGPDGRKELVTTFSFLGGILQDLGSNSALMFFIVVGMVTFLILWVIYGLVGVELYRTLKTFIKREKLDKTYQILLYPIGLFSAVIVYIPFLLTQPAKLFFYIFIYRLITVMGGRPSSISVAGSGQGEITPAWAYFYWIYEYLGLIFVIGIILSLIYTIYIIIKRKKRPQGQFLLLFLYFLIPLLLYTLISKKSARYLIPLAALFSIYIATHLPKLVELLLSNPKFKGLMSKHQKNLPQYISYVVLILLILPGSFHMVINDPNIGFDSGYDDAAKIVMNYAKDNPNETTYVFAHDKIALEFYMPYPAPSNIVIIPFAGATSNYSIDSLGRPYTYYPDEEVHEMLSNGTIDLAVDSPPGMLVSTDNRLKQYIYLNNTRVEEINENLAVYYL